MQNMKITLENPEEVWLQQPETTQATQRPTEQK